MRGHVYIPNELERRRLERGQAIVVILETTTGAGAYAVSLGWVETKNYPPGIYSWTGGSRVERFAVLTHSCLRDARREIDDILFIERLEVE